MSDLHHLFEEIGLNEKECKIYLNLLQIGSQAASVIAKRAELPRSSTFFHLDNLVKKGFVKKHNKNNIQYFSAISPEEIENILMRQENKIKDQIHQLREFLPLLNNFKGPFLQESKITHFEGVEGLCKMIDLLTQNDTPLYFISGHDFHPKIYDYIRKVYVPKREAMQSKSQMLVALSPQAKDYANYAKSIYEWIGFVDSKKVNFQSTIIIYDNKIQLQSIKSDDLNGMLVENQHLAQTMKAIFDFMKLSTWIQK